MKLWIALATLVVFAAGFAVGAATFLASASVRPQVAPGASSWGRWGDPFGRILSEKDCGQELDLSETQQQNFEEILRSYESSVQEVDRKRVSLRQQLRQDIEALLTPSQKDKLAALQSEKTLQELRVRVDGELADLKEKLSLSDAEVIAMRPILLEYGEARQKFPGPPGKQIDGLRERRNAQLREVLPAEKFTGYAAYKDNQWEWRRRSGSRQDKEKKPPTAP